MVRRERHIDGESGHQSRKIETIERGLSDGRDDCRTIKDATKKFLALARHLLSFYPGTHAKGDAAAKGTGKKK